MNIETCQILMKTFINYRAQAENTKDPKDIAEFKQYERHCIEKFKYLVMMKVSRYKNFHNYEDLIQEGLEALTKAMKNYNPSKGIFFYWAHKYIDTRISRCANLHTTIRFPLKYAKQVTPHRESILPLLVDQMSGPEDILEKTEMLRSIRKSLFTLSGEQRQVVQMLFGIDGQTPQSLTKVCKELRISRPTCIKLLGQVFNILKRDVQL